jgi:hypothetical protein
MDKRGSACGLLQDNCPGVEGFIRKPQISQRKHLAPQSKYVLHISQL